MGRKNNDLVRIRNRRYKIKRFLPQPKNINVNQNDRVVRRMVVRRQTIYPSNRRRRKSCLLVNVLIQWNTKDLFNQTILRNFCIKTPIFWRADYIIYYYISNLYHNL